jgi:hypothetical protein
MRPYLRPQLLDDLAGTGLLEGYLNRGIAGLSWIPGLLHNNDLMFSATDPVVLRSVANTYQVQWRVAPLGHRYLVAQTAICVAD